MNRVHTDVAAVKRYALDEIRGLPPAPPHLSARQARLRALLIEVIQRIARNPRVDRWPNTSQLLEESATLSAELGYPRPPARVYFDDEPDLAAQSPDEGPAQFTQMLDLAMPDGSAFACMVLDAFCMLPDKTYLSACTLSEYPDRFERAVEYLLAWIRHLDLPPQPHGTGDTPDAAGSPGHAAPRMDKPGGRATCPAEEAPVPSFKVLRDSFAVAYKGVRCPLGNSVAFKLIEALAARQGCFLETAELIRIVWPNQVVVHNSVSQAIGDLRAEMTRIGMTGVVIAVEKEHYALMVGEEASGFNPKTGRRINPKSPRKRRKKKR
jgi:DNA-binding winged helix-turn-helix (wHTH) protein